MELKAVRLIQRSKPLSNSKPLHFKVSVWNSTIKSSAFFFSLPLMKYVFPRATLSATIWVECLMWEQTWRVQCWASGGWGGAMEIQNVKAVEIARVETVSVCFSFLPRMRLPGTACQGQWPLSWAYAPELSVPTLPPSLRHGTLNSPLFLGFHDTSPSL